MRITGTILATLCTLSVIAAPVEAKKWTIYEREVQLSKEIDAGQKSGDLTLKEADGLRSDAKDIKDTIEKMKQKNGGKLSVKNENDLERQLNKLSLKIQKKKLDKRVQ